jgi:hypothetical protein
MPSNRKEMPPLWRVQELIKLSDRYPSGLEWVVDKACNKAGTQAGRMNKVTGFYMVCIDNTVYLAHRLVYFLQTEEDPLHIDIIHEKNNVNKDNRMKLIPTKRTNKKPRAVPVEKKVPSYSC